MPRSSASSLAIARRLRAPSAAGVERERAAARRLAAPDHGSASPPTTASSSIDASRVQVLHRPRRHRHARTTRSTRSTTVARAYQTALARPRARRHRRRARADPRPASRGPRWIGAPVFVVPAPTAGAARWRCTRSASSPADERCSGGPDAARAAGATVSRREAVALGRRRLRRRPGRPGRRRRDLVVFPTPEDTAYYVGVARNLLEGRGLVSRRALELPDATARLPAAGLRGLAAAADVPRGRHPDGHRSARRSRAAQVSSGPRSARSSRSSPGGWPPTSRRSAALPLGRARTLALGTGPDGGRLAAAPPPLDPARLDDAVRRARPGGVPADAPGSRRARRPARRRRCPTAGLVALGVLIGLAALTRNEAVWLGLAWVWSSGWRAAGRRARAASPLVAIPAAVALAIFAPWAIRDWLVFGTPVPRPGPDERPVGRRLRHLRLAGPADARPLPRRRARPGCSSCGSRASATTCSSVLLLPGAPAVAHRAVRRCRALARLAAAPAARCSCPRSRSSSTSLLFPVSTTWGTFLHAAGAGPRPADRLGSLVALDRLIVAVGRRPRLDAARRLARRRR